MPLCKIDPFGSYATGNWPVLNTNSPLFLNRLHALQFRDLGIPVWSQAGCRLRFGLKCRDSSIECMGMTSPAWGALMIVLVVLVVVIVTNYGNSNSTNNISKG